MAEFESLLFSVFDALRRQGLPLGVSDYLLAVKTIRSGVGLENSHSLKQLCSLLWVKSQQDQELFDVTFSELVEPELKTRYVSESLSPSTPKISSAKSEIPPRSGVPHDFNADMPESETEELPELQAVEEQISISVQSSKNFPTYLSNRNAKGGNVKKYYFTTRLPISQREMAGVWRQLRRPQRTGVPEDLDIEATIHSICQTGLFLHPVRQPRRRNQVKLLVLVDQQGSMAPFTPLINAVIESIERGGLLGKVTYYYFHDCPVGLLYQQPSLSGSLPLETVLDNQAKDNSVLIISDAGAAHGGYDSLRLTDTKSFLKTLNNYTYLYAWLNPMPCKRWIRTTAHEIAKLIPMFALDREGLNDAVNILRGHPFPPEVGIYE